MTIDDGRMPGGELRPVMYLDIDDTLVSWASGEPRPAPGCRRFLLWALQRFHVRWLSTWCPNGRMGESLLADLARMVEVDAERLGQVQGVDWESSGSKLDGIAWVEHLVLRRPFVWVEDDYGVGEHELRFLDRHGVRACYRCCNVSEDEQALVRLHSSLASEWKAGRFNGAGHVAAAVRGA